MEKYEFYLPKIEYDSFNTFVKKTKKNVPNLIVTFGDKFENKIYMHAHVDIDNHISFFKMQHEVIYCCVEIPTISDWLLIASYENGFEFVTNPSQKVEFVNPNHGKNYRKCDICNHWCKNNHVVRNIKTNEELQVGSECLKKFGIIGINFISKFTRELNRIYNDYCNHCDGEFYHWNGTEDKYAFSTCETLDLLKAAKSYYNKSKIWKKGYYNDMNVYVKSESNIEIQKNLSDKIFDGDEEYFNKVKEYNLKNKNNDSEFAVEMHNLCVNFYATPSNAPHAYFLIKNYEDYLKLKETNLEMYKDKQLHIISAKILGKEKFEGYFGDFIEYILELSNGVIAKRTGKLPINPTNPNLTGEFYATVKYININKCLIELDRTTKNPKKNVPVMEIL